MRLAHFSDPHLSVPPLAQPTREVLTKRMVGALNFYFGGRKKRFSNVDTQVTAMLSDIDEQRVDHVVCTGDLTGMALRAEFDGVAHLFQARLHAPREYTVLPGNHDRYTRSAVAEALFEQHFFALCEQANFPFIKELPGGVFLVALDTALARPFWDSSGAVGPSQLREARALLAEIRQKAAFVVLLLHYALLRRDGRPDRPLHGLRDAKEVLAMVSAEATHVDLILHGHLHEAFFLEADGSRPPIGCAGSATDLAHSPGYDIYSIEPHTRTITQERRVWNAKTQRYDRANARET